MEILRELEGTPRDVYCGAIGWIAPGGADALFAWRSAPSSLFPDGEAVYNVGGGVVFDSTAEAEYAGMSAESALRDGNAAGFELIETMRWEPGTGFLRCDRHLARLDGFGARRWASPAIRASVEAALGQAGRRRRAARAFGSSSTRTARST